MSQTNPEPPARRRHRRRPRRLDRVHPHRPAGLPRRAVRARTLSALPHRRIAHPRDVLGAASASNMLDKMQDKSVRQEVQRAVHQPARQAVRAVLLRRSQAARVFADLASDPQRVRPDDAEQRPRTWRRTCMRASACWRCCSRASRAVGVRIQEENGTEREVRADVVVDASGQSSMIMSRLGLREWDPVLKKAALWTYWEGAWRGHGPGRGRHAGLPDAGQEGLVLVHPAAQRRRQRRRRRRLRLPVQEPRRQGPRGDLLRGSRTLSRRQGPDRRRQTGRRLPRRQGVHLSLQAGGRRRLGAGRRRLRLPRSALLVRRAAGAEVGLGGGRRHGGGAARRATRRRRSWASGRPSSSRAWTGCDGWCANTTTASASAASSRSTRTSRAC